MRCVGVTTCAKHAVNLRILRLLSPEGAGEGGAWAPHVSPLDPPLLPYTLAKSCTMIVGIRICHKHYVNCEMLISHYKLCYNQQARRQGGFERTPPLASKKILNTA